MAAVEYVTEEEQRKGKTTTEVGMGKRYTKVAGFA